MVWAIGDLLRLWMIPNWTYIIKGVTHVHLGPIWCHSDQSLQWPKPISWFGLFCCFLQQTGSSNFKSAKIWIMFHFYVLSFSKKGNIIQGSTVILCARTLTVCSSIYKIKKRNLLMKLKRFLCRLMLLIQPIGFVDFMWRQ